MDIKLDNDHDIELSLDAFGQLNLSLITGVDAVVQDVDCRLKIFLGEWFLDTRIGVPYFEKILGQKPRLSVVTSILKEAIMSAPGMMEINDFVIDYEGVTRAMSVSFRGTCSEGVFTYDEEMILP